MELYYSSSSPYARKARIVVREKNLTASVEERLCNPYINPPQLRLLNPLGKVPTLMLPDGTSLYDSALICEYLDYLEAKPRLIPDMPARWQVLKAVALGDGVIDIAVSGVLEKRRPVETQSADWMQRWQTQILHGVDEMTQSLAKLPAEIHLGHIAYATALAYLEFRHPDISWRAGHAALAEWFDEFSQRPSMQATVPDDSSAQIKH